MSTEYLALAGLRMALHHQPAAMPNEERGRAAVLYVHGATFPSSLAVFWRFEGLSWADTLAAAGFDVYGIDQLGFGASDRYPQMEQPAMDAQPLGRAPDVVVQIAAAVDHIRKQLGVPRVHLVAHSWGTAAAALYASAFPGSVERLVLFAPIVPRAGDGHGGLMPAWHLVTAEAQWQRFSGSVPAGQQRVLPERWFDPWVTAFLDSDPAAGSRQPPAVQIPAGPLADLADMAAGRVLYDPALVRCPTLIVRGEWDPWPDDADAQRLFAQLSGTAIKRDVKIGRGTHVMHLEVARRALYREVQLFLQGDDDPA
jgi:pimeloyl-ACP methyl ester carboxylesterase